MAVGRPDTKGLIRLELRTTPDQALETRSVIDYYAEVRLESAAAGLSLKPSPTHIEQRPGKR